MTSLNLFALLFSFFGKDTLIVSTWGYNSTLSRQIKGDYYLERLLSNEFKIKTTYWEFSSWDSLWKRMESTKRNTAGIEYTPANWLTLVSGLDGVRNRTQETYSNQGYTSSSTTGFLESETNTDLLYSFYRLEYITDQFAYLGSDIYSSLDKTFADEAYIEVNANPCTLSFAHNREVGENKLNRGDTIEITSTRVPFLQGWFQTGGEIGKSRHKHYSDYQQLAGEIWLRDTFKITPNVGINLTGTFSLDTLTNLADASGTRKISDRYIRARIGYQVFQRTSLSIEFSDKTTIRKQVGELFDEDKNKYSFLGKITHNFTRRPSQARSYYSAPIPLSPGSITFTQALSLESIATPDSNNQDRDIATENSTLSLYWNPTENIYSYFYLNHNTRREHYLVSEEADRSNQNKSSYSYLVFNILIPKYLSLYNSTDIQFSLTRYYNDSTQNWANRSTSEAATITFFPEGLLQPTAKLSWRRSENWGMVSGELALTNQSDQINQRYTLSFIQIRREKSPQGWWWEDNEWLRISPFVGFETTFVPLEMQGPVDKSDYAGIEILYHPWPYVSLNGEIKFTRSDYEAPFETTLSINTSF
ncbi:hypothetical protein JXM67_04535 [candidate division WOR-3 bacterium]|nr:hypothetical protein [candidate division WOR-3 bacterium]